MEQEFIEIIGAKEHNLKNIDVNIPRYQLVVITGLSGSGKSSLAFDTIYAEGQRRYMETFSSYARQFIGEMERPDVEKITGLSPVISIEQKTTSKNPRSTVGTVTEIYDFLRLLYARVADAYSYNTGKLMVKYTDSQILESIFNTFHDKNVVVLAPLVRARKGHYRELFEQVRKQGYAKVRVDGVTVDITPGMQLDRYKTHDIEIVIDRLKVLEDRHQRLSDALQAAFKQSKGFIMVLNTDTNTVFQYSKFLMCADTGISYEEPSPNAFSFNSPYGYCPHCKGLGVVTDVDMNLVIPDNTKSINAGGIVPLGETRDNLTFKQLKNIAKKYKFSLADPINKVPEEALNVILNGGDDTFDNNWDANSGDYGYNLAEEGLIAALQRWYADTGSDRVRNWAEEFMAVNPCPECEGTRLRKESRWFKVYDKNIAELAEMDITNLAAWMENIEDKLSEKQNLIAKDILKEIRLRLGFLLDVGLDYLALHRAARTLSGGESQRIRLATQIGSQLTGITYILDEPSIGLHQRDNQKLINALRHLVTIGNSVLVVEHDKDIMLASDYLFDLGPGAGKHGGHIVAEGKPETFLTKNTVTADFLSGRQRIETPQVRRTSDKYLHLKGATGNNLKNVDLKLPLGTFICVSGVSGSGKSTLINETLYPILRQHFYNSRKNPLAYAEITGLEHLDKVIEIDQSPIGRTPRSNPATYIDVFTLIRTMYADVPEAKIRGYKPGRFSFNVKGGRCETCEGAGLRTIEMQFLPDVNVHCETCNGKRYNRETLEILYKGKSISDILDMTVNEATEFFEPVPQIYRKVKTLKDVGLGYITLGQQATTLSGGEAQRVKLAEELSKKDTGKTLYILDEPTTGLHFEDIRILLKMLNELVERGNTVLVIEHNMDVIKTADYVVDVGLEGGRGGGTIICDGTPEVVASNEISHTGRFLKLEL